MSAEPQRLPISNYNDGKIFENGEDGYGKKLQSLVAGVYLCHEEDRYWKP